MCVINISQCFVLGSLACPDFLKATLGGHDRREGPCYEASLEEENRCHDEAAIRPNAHANSHPQMRALSLILENLTSMSIRRSFTK